MVQCPTCKEWISDGTFADHKCGEVFLFRDCPLCRGEGKLGPVTCCDCSGTGKIMYRKPLEGRNDHRVPEGKAGHRVPLECLLADDEFAE